MSDTVQTILVIDDHPLMRKGITQLIAMEPLLRLVGEAGDGKTGLELALQQRPHLILLDLNMRGIGGLSTLRALKATNLESRVIILSVSDHVEDIVTALRMGADGYLIKDMEPEEVLHSLKLAAQGSIAIGERVATILAGVLRTKASVTALDYMGLTEREREVLGLIAVGDSNKVIARKLEISEGTVKLHVKHLLKKMHMSSRVEAAVWAVSHPQRRSSSD